MVDVEFMEATSEDTFLDLENIVRRVWDWFVSGVGILVMFVVSVGFMKALEVCIEME
jgi:hypothetical protein